MGYLRAERVWEAVRRTVWGRAVFAQDVGVHPVVHAWRSRMVNFVLPGVALLVFPVVVDTFVNNPLGLEAAGRLVFGFCYLTLAALAMARGVNYRARTWTVLLLVLAFSVFGTARTGSVGIGAFIMLGVPILALVLLGIPSGWLSTVISLAAYVGITMVAYAGIGPLSVPRTASLDPASWALQGLGLAGLLLPIVALLNRFLLLHDTILENERGALTRLTAETNERRRLERELVDAATRERRAIGQELHDGVCQQTAGAHLRVSVLATRAAAVDAGLSIDLRAIADVLQSATTDARRLTRGLCPVGFLYESLPHALAALAQTTQHVHGLSCTFHGSAREPVFEDDTVFHLYKIAQEAVANAVRHAQATAIEISLDRTSKCWQLTIKDDGIGLGTSPEVGLGLQIMEYRAKLMGAILTTGSAGRGRGTVVMCSLAASSEVGQEYARA